MKNRFIKHLIKAFFFFLVSRIKGINMDSKFRKFRKSFRETTSWIPRDFSEDLETRKEYTERWISIYIIYFTMFLISLGFSIILTGVWPYLDKVI